GHASADAAVVEAEVERAVERAVAEAAAAGGSTPSLRLGDERWHAAVRRIDDEPCAAVLRIEVLEPVDRVAAGQDAQVRRGRLGAAVPLGPQLGQLRVAHLVQLLT